MKQIGILLLSAVLIFAVTGFGQDTRSAADAGPTAGDAVYARPGQLVSAADGARLNLYCIGERLAHRHLRFRMGRLGASVVEGAATDRKVDARLQL